MDFGRFIGRLWRRGDERGNAECAAWTEPAQAERHAGPILPGARDVALRQQPLDEQAGDSFLGYVD